MKLSTIGFTKKPARRFFDLLRASGARRVVDVRLNNGSQLAGFAKKDDLAWFLDEICGIDLPVALNFYPYMRSLHEIRGFQAEAACGSSSLPVRISHMRYS